MIWNPRERARLTTRQKADLSAWQKTLRGHSQQLGHIASTEIGHALASSPRCSPHGVDRAHTALCGQSGPIGCEAHITCNPEPRL